MDELIADLPQYVQAIWDTLYIVVISLVASGVAGLVLGVALATTRSGGLLANRVAYTLLNVVVNIVRPIPFIIFVTAIDPLTILVVGTTIGPTAGAFALSIAAAFAVSRIVEQSLVGVEPGVLEAARAAGAGPVRIIATVLIPEGLGPLVLGYTFLFVGIVDMTAQVGAIGGGGLGDFAITYGAQRYNWPIVYLTVATIVVLVQVGQFAGNTLARRALRR
jgi:D-methionine transport system permease protein